jgi:ketopantoate reductase
MGWEQVIKIHSSPNNIGWGLLSHTVGSKRYGDIKHNDGGNYQSSSHAVGFKPYKLVKGLVETLLRESSSHTVGLEQ